MKSSKYQQVYLLLLNYKLGGFVRKHKFQNNVVSPSANFKQTGKINIPMTVIHDHFKYTSTITDSFIFGIQGFKYCSKRFKSDAKV